MMFMKIFINLKFFLDVDIIMKYNLNKVYSEIDKVCYLIIFPYIYRRTIDFSRIADIRKFLNKIL